jgi:cation diffusion facilitator CzcD-associated flavoprotein CzcO
MQRTPSSVDQRDNAPIDPKWFEEIATPGWQQRWLENFTMNQAGFGADVDLVNDGWTDLARRIRNRIFELPPDQRTPANMWMAYEDSDNEKMEEIRARAERLVKDQETAEKLKAWYRQLCKRPCFHDEYLQAFNNPGTHLIDTDGKGVERITEKGIVELTKANNGITRIYAGATSVTAAALPERLREIVVTDDAPSSTPPTTK